MNKQTFLKRTKNLLRGVLAHRTYLWKNNLIKTESSWAAREVANINNAIPKLVDADKARTFLEKHESAIRFLIPSDNLRNHNELRELLNANLN